MSHEVGSDFRKWDQPSIALFLKKRWWKRHANPPGPSVTRYWEDNTIRREETDVIRVTEGS